MPTRVLCCWCRDWPVVSWRRRDPALRGTPVAVVARGTRGELVRAVKTVGERATLFLTAYWQSLMTNDRLNIPSDRVMPKPPDVPDLLHKLIDVLGIDDGR